MWLIAIWIGVLTLYLTCFFIFYTWFVCTWTLLHTEHCCICKKKEHHYYTRGFKPKQNKTKICCKTEATATTHMNSMANRLCDDNGWNGVVAIKNCIQTSSSTTNGYAIETQSMEKLPQKAEHRCHSLLLLLWLLHFRLVKSNLLLVAYETNASRAHFWLICYSVNRKKRE